MVGLVWWRQPDRGLQRLPAPVDPGMQAGEPFGSSAVGRWRIRGQRRHAFGESGAAQHEPGQPSDDLLELEPPARCVTFALPAWTDVAARPHGTPFLTRHTSTV